MGAAVHRLNVVERRQFRKNQLQQSRTIEIVETRAGMRCHKDFVQLVLNALATDDFQSLGIATQCLESLIFDVKPQLCGEAHAAQHTQGVVAEGDIRIERRTNDSVFQVVQPVERIDKLAKPPSIQAYCHRVDGEVTTVLVVLQRAIFNDGLTRVVAVTLATGTDEFYFERISGKGQGARGRRYVLCVSVF